LSLSF
ncbi:4-hydroxybenzoate decarboxylase subunit C, partial [Chlamydia psittaci C1/97]|jgi:hypothetical protein